MSSAVKDVALVARDEGKLVETTAPASFVDVLERLALNPEVPVDKLERIMAMQERILAHNAKSEFDAAFAVMQGELPIITERGEIEVDGKVRSKYARYEDIIEVVRPIMGRHGFGLRHKNETLPAGKFRIVGILSHRAGHAETDEFEFGADTSGKKNDVQAIGSTRSYGQRYTTIALLNIVTRGTDDNGKAAGQPAATEPPHGYGDWVTDLAACADEGLPALTSAWNASKQEFKSYILANDRSGWESLKRKAQAVRR